MFGAKYEALKQESSELLDAETPWTRKEDSKSKRQLCWTMLVSFLLVISAILNVMAYLPTEKLQGSAPKGFTVPHEANIPVTYWHDDRSLYDPIWDEPRYNYTAGLMAVDDSYVGSYNLPQAQRWPWDASKSIYMLLGWHSIHCVMVLRDAMIAVDQGKPMPYQFGHIVHCLHNLRDDVTCYADDTPMYTGAFNAEVGKRVTTPGAGQVRMCRDWDAVRQYAVEHSACYDAKAGGLDGPEVNKYKFCPDGSKPWL